MIFIHELIVANKKTIFVNTVNLVSLRYPWLLMEYKLLFSIQVFLRKIFPYNFQWHEVAVISVR